MKKQSYPIPVITTAFCVEINKNRLNCLSSFDAAKGIYDISLQKNSSIMIYSSIISVDQYK